MKKKVVLWLAILFVLFVTISVILFINKREKAFYLEDSYYGTNDMIELKNDELNKLIDKKESFAVFIYQPLCITSSDFENILSQFLEDNQTRIYKIAFSNIKETDLGKSVKYYPSFIIYNKGKMVDFLEADKDEDVRYYSSKDEFESWFTRYVKLKNSPSSNTNASTNSSNVSEENDLLKDINLEDVIKQDNKVNIYFFWGNGCPHCEEELEFFESIKEKYGDYYNLYTFETWYNEENAKLINIFAESMGEKVTGVPYTIIGNKTFKGFKEEYKSDFINAIEKQHKNSYDVYFDKIKK